MLPLQGSPGSMPLWLMLVLFGIPAAVVVASFVVALAHGAPTWPVLIAGSFALAVSALAMLWIRHMLRRIGVSLEGDALVVDAGAARKRFRLAKLRAGGLRIVDLDERKDLRRSFAPGASACRASHRAGFGCAAVTRRFAS
jgi:hypothetical protein